MIPYTGDYVGVVYAAERFAIALELFRLDVSEGKTPTRKLAITRAHLEMVIAIYKVASR